MCFAESIGKLGFFAMLTMFPAKLGAKLDRLTIGVLPIKMKALLILDAPRWMSMLMGLFSLFMSKKMKQRMVRTPSPPPAVLNLDPDPDPDPRGTMGHPAGCS